MSDLVKAVSDADFDVNVLAADGPVLVDFWAEWCGPCRTVAPLLDEIADEYEGQLSIRKLDVDQNPQAAAAMKVRSIPFMAVFNKGEVVASRVGACSLSELRDFVEKSI